jgi:DNA polymerase-3 subunit epsilon
LKSGIEANLKIERPILFLDLESTGVDPCIDRIVELGVSILNPDGTVKPKGWSVRFNPTIPIPEASTKIHGITDAMVKDLKPFSEWAAKLHEKMKGKDLAGYNLRRLDLPLLDEEFRRCGLSLDLTGVRVIDVQAIYFKANPRGLEDAVRQYCKRDHTAVAHGAGADADATLEVWLAQLDAHPELPNDIDAMAKYATLGEFEPVDIAGRLYRDQVGDVRFAFGKNKDRRVLDEHGYVRWMIEKGSFPGSTLDALRDELDRGLVQTG